MEPDSGYVDNDTDQPPSSTMLHVCASTMYPLPPTAAATTTTITTDSFYYNSNNYGECKKSNNEDVLITSSSSSTPLLLLPLPFALLCGEGAVHAERTVDGLLAVTNYRLYIRNNGDRHWHVPLGLIETVEVREMFYLHIGCKDARSYRCTFETNDQCTEWFRRLLQATSSSSCGQLHDLFAFCFRAWAAEPEHEHVLARFAADDASTTIVVADERDFQSEMKRLRFDIHGAWRISQANINYRLCASYPPLLFVPACISDDTLETVARFRSSRRIPVVVWRHTGNGAVICRCSQPEVGWLGWRSSEDEDLLKAIADACAYDKGPSSIILDVNAPTTDNITPPPLNLTSSKKVLIMDARSYTTAVANRARGGGCECPEYYPSCDIQFMNLANIHSIRKSFHSLRQLCASAADQPNWWSLLEGTRWLQHMSGLMRSAVTLVAAVERDGRPVLVHCSDGWDRTPQIVALAEILLDPYYRTVNGFRVLVEREWLAFGHKFADRCGHTTSGGPDDPNERCPVFLQWLDCVHQLLVQFPCSFQFSNTYLIRLAQHTYSNLFGTFLCNTKQERMEQCCSEKTFSVWPYLNALCFTNHLYSKRTTTNHQVLWPACNVRDLQLWSELYLGSLETSSSNFENSLLPLVNNGVTNSIPLVNANTMTKTRSYSDLMGASVEIITCHNNNNNNSSSSSNTRRNSDPNITIESIKLNNLSIEENNKVEVNGEMDLHHYHSIIRENGYSSSSRNNNVNEEEEESKCDSKLLLNENGDDNDDSDSKSVEEITVYDAAAAANNSAKSNETSTDTLVAENVVNNIIVEEPIVNDAKTLDGCGVCAQNRKLIQDKHFHTKRVKTPPPPLYTPSCGDDDDDGGILLNNNNNTYYYNNSSSNSLDADGLIPLRSDLQYRLWQIQDEHQRNEELLKRELYMTRMALIKQVCHNCSHNELLLITDRPDDVRSLVGSVCSTGDGQASVAESLPSDLSWESLEEAAAGSQQTLWVPDHAVSQCTGCQTEFWLGRRKHHCRNCGRIFCADCSENSTPLPSEQLYNPVRVCTSCFTQLKRNYIGATDKCKQSTSATQQQQQQLTAQQ